MMTERMSSIANLAVEEMRIYRFDVPLREVFTIATMSLSQAQNLLVELKTNEGISGWGEASPFHSIAGETQGINIAAAREGWHPPRVSIASMARPPPRPSFCASVR